MASVGATAHRVRFEAGAHPVRVICDPDVIRRVIGNLVANAVRFTPKDGVCRVQLEGDTTAARVTVTDTGERD